MSLRRARVRPVLQMDIAECGAACLAMVLSAHGREVGLEEVRERCGTTRDGTDAKTLALAGESYGLTVRAFRREPGELSDLPLPAILHWRFNHFVVLETIDGDQFSIVDPASGRRSLDRDEMDRSFTGLSVALVPGESFVRGGRRASVASMLVGHVRGSWDAVTIVLLCGLAGVVPGLILSGAVATLVDHVIGESRGEWLLYLLGAVAAATLLQAAVGALREWTVAALRTKIAVAVAARAFHHALFLPLAFFAQRRASEIVSRLRAGSELGGTIAGPLVNIPPNAVTAVAYLAVITLTDVTVGAAVAAVSLVNLVVLRRLSLRLAEANSLQHVLEGTASGVAAAGLAAFDHYRLLGRQDLLARNWLAAEEAALDAEQRLGLVRTLAGLGPAGAAFAVATVALCVGAFRVMQGDLTLGELIALQVLAGSCAAPIAAIASAYCDLQDAAGALTRLDDLQSHPREALQQGTQIAVARRQGLVLENVSFGFGGESTLFEHVDIALEPGTLTALTGPSGAGKSTLARIAAGLLAPRGGSVKLDGIALGAWSHDELRRRLAYVPQANAVFTGTIAENVTLWNDASPRSDVVAALRLAGAERVVAARAGGLDAQIAHQAPGFSGGELQRLALARALAGRPDVVVLDETTSALDPLCEADVIAGLRRSGAAVLIVTHRNGTAARCDRVLHLSGRGDLAVVPRPNRDLPEANAAGQDARIRA